MTEAVRRLGKYEIIEEIGKGGFATVYRARDLDLGREVALKVLDPLLTRDPVWVARFRREARAAATLDHPRIVTVHEIGQAEGTLFIAMKLVEGGSLAQRLAGGGSLPWDEAVRVVSQVAKALDYAHGQGVLHRDLKPANVLLDPRSGAVLTDFGFARLLADNSLSVSMSGGIVGTPATMAPEVWEGQEPTAQADVYALGCILYELVAGRPLFSGATPPAVMLAHFKPLTLPAQWPEGTPPGLDEVLQTALARDPAARYPRAGDLAAAVAALTVDRLAEPYAALQAAVAGQQWPEALALAGEIKTSQPDYRDVAVLERQALASLEQAARAQSAAQWRATAEEALAAGDLAAAQLALKQWQQVRPEDPELASVQARVQLQVVEAAESDKRETETRNKQWDQTQVVSPPVPPTTPPGTPAPAGRSPGRGRSVWALAAVGALAAIVVLMLALRGGIEPPHTGVAVVTVADTPAIVSTNTLAVPTATAVRPTDTPGAVTYTWVPPTDTPQPETDATEPLTDAPLSPTSTPTFGLPVLAGTPMPQPSTAIVPESASDVIQLAQLNESSGEFAFSPDGELLAVAYMGIHVYNARTLDEIRVLETDRGISSIAFSPNGQTLAAGDGYNVVIWRVSDWEVLHTLRGHTGEPWELAFSFDGQTLASGSWDDTTRLWRVADGALLRIVEENGGGVLGVALSPDGQTLAVGSVFLRLWRVADGRLLRTLEGHTDWVHSIAFSPDGQILASGSDDDTVRLWRVSDGMLLRTLEGHSGWVRSIAFSPDGQVLASGSEDNTVRLWRVDDGMLLKVLEGHSNHWWPSVAFSPDGRFLASGSSYDPVRLWGAHRPVVGND